MVILASTSLSTIALVNKHSLAVAFSNRMPAQLAQRGGMGLIPTTLLFADASHIGSQILPDSAERPHGICAAMWLL
jgi:hypothetical protein